MLGSLNDFIEMPEHANLQIRVDNDEEMMNPISPITKYSRRKTIQYQKKRTMSGVQSYKASDKSLLFEKFSKNYPMIEKNKRQGSKIEDNSITENRKKISESRLSSLFYGQSPSKMMSDTIARDPYGGLSYNMGDEITKTELKRQHNLLRAIVRTKMNQQQKITNTHYEDSFNRMSAGLKKIKIRQIAHYSDIKEEEQPKTNRSLQLPIKKRANTNLSNKDRVSFENCLNWTKKRNKNGSYYAQKLGKNLKIENEDNSVEARKSMLQLIHQRSSSVGLQDYN